MIEFLNFMKTYNVNVLAAINIQIHGRYSNIKLLPLKIGFYICTLEVTSRV